MYAVVCFLGENAVSVVPRFWLYSSGQDVRCRWPPATVLKGKALNKAIEARSPADPDWDGYEVKVLVETDNYYKARYKCKKAEENTTTDMATTDDQAKRKHRTPARILSSDDDAPGENECDVDDMPHNKRKKQNGNSVSPSVPTAPHVMPIVTKSPIPASPPGLRSLLLGTQTSPSSDNLGQTPSHMVCSPQLPGLMDNAESLDIKPSLPGTMHVVEPDTPERDRMTFELMERIYGQVKQNTLFLQSILKLLETRQVDNNSAVEEFGLPVDTEAEFQRLEEVLANTDKRKCLVTHLCSLGGFGAKEAVDRMLLALITNALARSFNWAGKGFKTGVGQTRIIQAIKDAAKQIGIKEAEAEAEIKKWLRGAGDREGGRKLREQKKKENENVRAQRTRYLDDMAQQLQDSD